MGRGEDLQAAAAAAFADAADLAIARVACRAAAQFPSCLGPTAGGSPWQERSRHGDVVVYEAEIPKSSIKAFKAVCECLPYTVEQLRSAILDPAERESWDHSLSHFGRTLLGKMPASLPASASACAGLGAGEAFSAAIDGEAEVSVIRSITKSMFAVSPRDFADASFTYYDGQGGCWSMCGGIEAEDARFAAGGGAVRGHNTAGLTGWALEPVSGGTKVYYVIHSDVKGWLPKAVVNNAVASSFVNFFADIRAHLDKKLGTNK